jgi:hypothetical protein
MILDKLDKLSRREKIGLVLGLTLVFLLLVDRIVVESVIGTLSELKDEIKTTSAALDYTHAVLKNKDTVSNEYGEVSGLLEIVESEAVGIEQMKAQIDAMLTDADVTPLSMEHRDPIPRDSYEEYVLDIGSYEGKMDGVLAFLYQMHDEKLVGLPRINRLIIKPGKEGVVVGSMLITKIVREAEIIR